MIAANQPGDSRYSAAAQVTGNVVVLKAPQAVVFAALAGRLATDAAFTLAATGGASGNAVTFATSSAVCGVSGKTVTMIGGAGTCSVRADQAGDANYNPAASVTQDFTVSLAPQTINFATIASFSRRDLPAIPLVATSSSGLPVVFSLISGPCAVSGASLMAIGAGKCVIVANQVGNMRYAPAATVTQTVQITDVLQAAVGGCGSTGSSSGFELFAIAAAGLVLYRRRRLTIRQP